MAEENIPKDDAMSICDKIRKENKKLGFARIQCLGCMKYAKSDSSKRCLNSQPGYRGYSLFNKSYDKENKR